MVAAKIALRSFATPALALALAASTALAGDLNPPPGPIAPTMKSLDALAPGICINDLPGDASAMHVITEPGVYFMSDDIVAPAGRSAVVVDLAADPADDPVMIDLNGYSLFGEAGSLHGVHFASSFVNGRYVLRAGIPSASTISGMGGDAIHIENADAVSLSSLSISNCLGDGVEILASKKLFVGNLSIADCGGDGISSSAEEIYCDKHGRVKVQFCVGNGMTLTNLRECTMENVSVSDNGGTGIDATAAPGGPFKFSSREGNLLANNGTGIRVDISGTTSATIRVNDTTCSNNASHGIHVLGTGLMPQAGVTTTTVAHEMGHNFSTDNGGDGIRVELDATASPSLHCVSSTLRGNTGDGLYCVGSAGDTFNDIDVRDSDASGNAGSGLRASGRISASNTTANDNTGDGLSFTAAAGPGKANAVVLVGFRAGQNQGSGSRVILPPLSGPASVHASQCTFDENQEHGSYLDDDSDGDVITDIDECSASGNGLGGFTEDHGAPSSAKKKTNRKARCTAHANNGPGFSVTGAVVDHFECAATDNTGDGFAVAGQAFVLDGCSSLRNDGNGYVHLYAGAPAARQTSSRSRNALAAMRSRRVGWDSYMTDYRRSIAVGNGLDGFNITADVCNITDCSSSGNDDDGFDIAPGDPVSGINVSLEQIVGSTNGGRGTVVTGAILRASECTMTGNTGTGLDAPSCEHVHIFEGDYSSNAASGATIEVSGTLVVSGAAMCGNAGHGLSHSSSIGVAASSVDITNCRCSSNTLSGIFLSDSFGGRVQSCAAFANGASGIEVLSFAHVVTNNVFGNNAGANLSVALPGNSVGPLQDEFSAPTTDNASNYTP